jgi:hypothetical protein
MNILTALKHQERIASRRGDLEEDRANAIDHYHGRPYGDEVEGRSQVVMRDVSDTIEWIKPSLMKVFAAGDEVVRFDPVGPEDEKQAEQETDYCNHVLMTRNNGFIILHDWFHDALLQRNGYVMVRAVKKEKANKERYEHLTDDEFALLMQSEGIELLEHELDTDDYGQPTHKAVVRSVQEYTCIEVVNIPPERVLVAPDWPGVTLEGCPFVEVIDHQTISSLRAAGYDVPDTVNDDTEADDGDEFSTQREVSIDGFDDRDDIEADPSTRRVKVRYAWMMFDEDGDGIAELRRIVAVGDTILENEEDDLCPVAAITPGRMPHEHIGQSVDDWVNDLQRIHTVLMRGFLDSTYMAMNPQTYVDVNKVNIDDLMVNRVGGIRRVNGDPSTAVQERVMPNTAAATLQAMEVIRSVRENRTGVTAYNQGMNADSLNKTATGINQIMTASQQRIEMVARVFAETGVKALMLIIHAMSIKHGRQHEMIKLRNEWVPIDPRGWKTRRDVTVSVGIGTGNKDQMLQHLFMILQEQKQALALGLATPQNLYNALKRITQNAGFKQAEEFWTDVGKMPPQPQQPPPEIQKAQMQIQADQAEAQARRQDEAFKFQAEQQMQIAVDQNRQEYEARQKDRELEQTAQLERMRAEYQAQQDAQRLSFERWKVEFDRETRLMLAGMQQQTAMQSNAMRQEPAQ